MCDPLCTILNAIVQCAYFTIVNQEFRQGKLSHSEVRGFETIISQRKKFFSTFLHNFYINIMYILHTGCSITNCGLVFTLPIFRQLWLVDLPGLVKNPTSGQDENIEEQVKFWKNLFFINIFWIITFLIFLYRSKIWF